jgi:diguanylate cyclase (GGDEF)-like protein
MSRRATTLLLLTAALAVSSPVAPPGTAEPLWVGVLLAGALATTEGIRHHRPAVPRAWRPLRDSLLVFAGATALGLLIPPPTDAGFHPLVGTVFAAGYPLQAIAAIRFARAGSGGRDRGPVLDSVIVTVALTAVLAEGALLRHGGFGPDTVTTLSGSLLASLLGAWVLGMTLRAFLTWGASTVSGWSILLSSACNLAGVATLVWFGLADGAPTRPVLALWAGAILLLATGANHRSMTRLTEANDVERAHTIARTVLPSTALLVPPLAVVGRAAVDGTVAWVAAVATVLAAVVVVVRFSLLVRDREQARAALRAQALHDELTGLPNRRLLMDRLTQALHRRRSDGDALAVLFLDLDGFKAVNDNFGHGVGDELLREVGDRLRTDLRPQDTLARVGGDEFVLLATSVDRGAAVRVGDRVLAALRAPFAIAGHEVQVGASLGLAHVDDVGSDPNGLLTAADDAMYLAKQWGRHQLVVAQGRPRTDRIARANGGAPPERAPDTVHPTA